MKQKTFLIFAVICNIILLFIYIHKQNWLIQLSYQKQKNETALANLTQKKTTLKNALYQQRQPNTIKKAAQKIGMQTTDLTKIYRIGTCKPTEHK